MLEPASRYPELTSSSYSEMKGSPRITCDDRGVTGERTFKVHGSVLQKFLAAVRGSPKKEDPPDSLPDFPAIMCVRASAVPMENARGLVTNPDGSATGKFSDDRKTPTNPLRMTSEWWIVTAGYEATLSFSYDFAGEAISLPTNKLAWNDEPGTPIVGQSIVTILPAGELQIVRKNQPQLVRSKIDKKIGTVNNADFSPLLVDQNWRNRVGIGSPAIYSDQDLRDAVIPEGSAVFLGASSNPAFDPLGGLFYDVTYKFGIRPDFAPWNYYFRVSKAIPTNGPAGRWDRLYVTEQSGEELSQTEFQPLPPANFDELFT